MSRIYTKLSDETKTKIKISLGKRRNKSTDEITRFWSYVDIRDLFDCWEWTGAKNHKGYGYIDINGNAMRANRFSWILAYGEIPTGKHILHKCNNPACINPLHLYAGTNQENMRDKVNAGRQSRLQGESHPFAKLTERQVLKIRENKDNLLQKELAKIYEVGVTTIDSIIKRKSWKHI